MTQAARQDEPMRPAADELELEGTPRRPRRPSAIATAGPYVVLVLAIAFLAFVAGSFVTFKGVFPGKQLTDAFKGGQALLEEQATEPAFHVLDEPVVPERPEGPGLLVRMILAALVGALVGWLWVMGSGERPKHEADAGGDPE